MSIAPPGGFGTTRLTVRDGNVWAVAETQEIEMTSINRKRCIGGMVALLTKACKACWIKD
jgi:hypothetical protein